MISSKVPENVNVIVSVNKYKFTAKTPTKYYTSIINDKQSILSFATDQPTKQCAQFISMYRSRYGHYPSMCNDDIDKHTKNPFAKKRKNIDLREELVIIQESSEELIKKCLLTNLGLILIHEFNYSFVRQDHTEVNYSAQEIDLGTQDVRYSIEDLNKMLNYY